MPTLAPPPQNYVGRADGEWDEPSDVRQQIGVFVVFVGNAGKEESIPGEGYRNLREDVTSGERARLACW
jgi:hypothetical protein